MKKVDLKKEEIPEYLENLIEVIVLLNAYTSNMGKSCSIVLFDGKKSKFVKPTEPTNINWIDKKIEITKDCNYIASKIRGWLGFY